MVQVSYPGVYIQEIPSGFRAISGVSTSIAVFVGMAKRGPLLTPTRVLGLKDYERVFSPDTSQGEMTDQIRQFFINKGEQAFVVRIANGAIASNVVLDNEEGTDVLRLDARDAGVDGDQIRARVDYNTASPERTFNLTVYRETFDANGAPIVSALETYTGLGMNPNGIRYAPTVINDLSQLVRATDLEAVIAEPGYSASAGIFDDDAAVVTAITNAITNAGPAGSTIGRLRIKVGDAPWVVVELDSTALAFGDIEDRINERLTPHSVSVSVANLAAAGPLIITAAGDDDVLIDRAPDFDIAQELGLGASQGGIEYGSFARARPRPSALVSILGPPGGSLDALLSFGEQPKAGFNSPGVAVVRPFTVPAATPIPYPSAAGNMNAGNSVPGGPSLRNIRENLLAIANTLSAESDDWRAEVHGHRLALIPEFGDSSAGPNAEFSSVGPDLGGANQIFDTNAVIAQRAAQPLGGGDDGAVPEIEDYEDAFQQLDERVDLFNLLLLPRSENDVTDIRSTVWGPASSFCQIKRAFLIAEFAASLPTPDDVLEELPDLRTGVVKDHAGVWWPEVAIVSNGTRKNIGPSGSIAGVMARIDGSRGVWKAPAGLEADIRGVLGVRVPMSDPQNGLINPEAVNAVRSFPAGVVSWGARTMDGFDNSGNTDYRYVPVRRFALFIEESLIRGLRFAVFEPNDEPLWAQIRLAAGAFMNGLFRKGAFAGKSASQAYFVKADAETTTPLDQALGVVNVLVGFAPLRPAEFVVITVQQMAGQVQV